MVQEIARDLCVETAVVIVVIGHAQRQKETKSQRRDGKRYADCEVSFHNTAVVFATHPCANRNILRRFDSVL